MQPLATYRLVLSALVTAFGFAMAEPTTAQVFSTLHHFNNTNDGDYADHELVLSNHTLYGTAMGGGRADRGTVFSVSTDGTAFSLLHEFTCDFNPPYPNADGAYPYSGVILSGDWLYGTAYNGGTALVGIIYKLKVDGTGFTNLHSFAPFDYAYPIATNSDGGYPIGGLALAGETLFGTTSRGGTLGYGTVFAMNSDGTGFTNLHHFAQADGANALGTLLCSGSTLYGTTHEGGPSGSGTIFRLSTNGTAFTVLHSFASLPRYPLPATNSDGANPSGGLIIGEDTLYGTTITGGDSYGGVFAVHTNGMGFTNLHLFTATCGDCQTNSGGAYAQGRLVLLDNTLYGTTSGSEIFGPGTIFALNIDGSGFSILHTFSPGTTVPVNLHINEDGCYPRSGLLLDGKTLFGTAGEGGRMGYGTVYALSLVPYLNLSAVGSQVVLSWPTNVGGFAAAYTLQCTTNFALSNSWRPVSPSPLVKNGLNTVSNIMAEGSLFCRLSP